MLVYGFLNIIEFFCYSCYGYQTIRPRCANSVVSDHLFNLLMQISISTIHVWSTQVSFVNCFLSFLRGEKKIPKRFFLSCYSGSLFCTNSIITNIAGQPNEYSRLFSVLLFWNMVGQSNEPKICTLLPAKKIIWVRWAVFLFWALLIPNFHCLIHVECCVDLWCYNSIITLITGIFALSQLLAQWFECFKIIFCEFVDLYIVMNYLKLERIRREREREKKEIMTNKKDL